MDENVRYGASLLDLEKYGDYAVIDETLIRGSNGRVFYKRNDGHIVTFKDDELTASAVTQVIQTVGLRKEDYFRIDEGSSEITGNVIYSNINLGKIIPLEVNATEAVDTVNTITVKTAIVGNVDTLIIIPKGDNSLGILNYINDIAPITLTYTFTIKNTLTNETISVNHTMTGVHEFTLKQAIIDTYDETTFNSWKSVRASTTLESIRVVHNIIDSTLLNKKEKNWNTDLALLSTDVIIRDNNITYGAPLDNSLFTRILYLTRDQYNIVEASIGKSAPNSFEIPFEDIPESDLVQGYYITLDGIYYVDEDGNVTLIATKSPPTAPVMSFIEPMIFRPNTSNTGPYHDLDKLEAFLFGKDTPIYPARELAINIVPYNTTLYKGQYVDLYMVRNNIRVVPFSSALYVLSISAALPLSTNTSLDTTTARLTIGSDEQNTEITVSCVFDNIATASSTFTIVNSDRPMIKLTPQLYEVARGDTIDVAIESYGFVTPPAAADLTYLSFDQESASSVFSVKNRDNFIFSVGSDETVGNIITLKVKAPTLDADAVGICEIIVL